MDRQYDPFQAADDRLPAIDHGQFDDDVHPPPHYDRANPVELETLQRPYQHISVTDDSDWVPFITANNYEAERDNGRPLASRQPSNYSDAGLLKGWQGQSVPLIKSKRRLIVFIGLALAWFVRGAEDTIISTIGPNLASKFNAFYLIGWFHAAYLLPQATLSIGLGKLSIMVKIRPYGSVCAIPMIGGTVICIAAASGEAFVLGRAVAGLGMAAMVPLAATMLADITTPSERPIYFALIIGIEVLSLAIGALTGGAFDSTLDYRWGFGLTLVLKIVAIFLALWFYEPVPRAGQDLTAKQIYRQFDIVGFIILSLACLMSLMAPQMATESGSWGSSSVLLSLVLSAALFGLFVLHQASHHDPDHRFLPRGLFSKDITLILVMGFCVVMAMYTVVSLLPVYYQVIKGLNSLQTSVNLLGYLLPLGAFSLLTGASLAVVPWANPIIWTGTGLATIGLFLLTLLNARSSTAMASGLSAVSGAGFGIAQTLGIVFSQQWVPVVALQPLMVSVALSIQLYGGSLGLVLGSALLNGQISSRLAAGFPQLSAATIKHVMNELSHGGLDAAGGEEIPAEVIASIPDIAADATRVVFYMASGAAAMSLFASFFIQWAKPTTGRR